MAKPAIALALLLAISGPAAAQTSDEGETAPAQNPPAVSAESPSPESDADDSGGSNGVDERVDNGETPADPADGGGTDNGDANEDGEEDSGNPDAGGSGSDTVNRTTGTGDEGNAIDGAGSPNEAEGASGDEDGLEDGAVGDRTPDDAVSVPTGSGEEQYNGGLPAASQPVAE